MKKFLFFLLFTFAFSGDLQVCINKNISQKDKVLLVKWVVAAYANSDKLKGFVKVDKKEALKVQKEVAKLFNDLISKKCNKEFKEALLKGNIKEIQNSFFDLGKVAGLELAKDVKVESYLLKTFQFIDLNKMMVNIWSIKLWCLGSSVGRARD